MGQEVRHFIGGREAKCERFVTRVAPATGERLSQSPTGTKQTVRDAVAAARAALPGWRALPVAERAKYLTAMADWLVAQYGEAGASTWLKDLIVTEVGKPLPEADIEVIETSDFIRYFANVAEGELAPDEPALDQNLWAQKRSVIEFAPRGVVAIIKPWNYPLEMIAWSLAPALVAGNTVVVKPSEKSPLVANVFSRMARECQLPDGVVNIVYGDGETGAELVAADGVNYVTFTGSVRAGKLVAAKCAERLVPCALELGGNDAAIVLADADLELAANGLVWGAFCNAGQVCVGTKRAYVDRKIFDALLQRINEKTSALRLGVDLGPMVDDTQRRSVTSFVDDAVKKGAKAHTASGPIPHKGGFYLQPTVLTNVPESAKLIQEECFGPVLPIWPFDTEADAVKAANSTTFGLGASIWTSDLEKGKLLARELDVGMVWINDVNVALPQTPWGGVKSSGIGFELSAESIREYTIRKHLNSEMNTEQRRAWWYPYGTA